MNDIPLTSLLQAAAERMSTDLRQRLITHPGELGTAREQIIRDFLKSRLPKRFDVGTGFAFDCSGNISKQLDVVIFDSLICPRFELPGGKSLFPCECVVAVGQVKSNLSSQRDLSNALDNLESVKVLDRSARGTAYDLVHQEVLDPKSNHFHQVFTFLLVVDKSMHPDTLAESIMTRAFESSAETLPNVIASLDRYLVTYCCDGGVCPNVMHARGIAIQSAYEPGDIILRFYLMLGRAIDSIRTASLPYWQYLETFRNFDAKVLYSTVDDPPPILGNWSR